MLVSTDDGAVVRMWMTRRFVKLLWPLLVKLAEDANPRITVQANPDANELARNAFDHRNVRGENGGNSPENLGQKKNPGPQRPPQHRVRNLKLIKSDS